MSLRRPRNYLHIDPKNPKPTGTCDLTGIRVLHEDLVPQYEYNAKGLYFTGKLVYKDFADKPNPQFLRPNIEGDLRPVQTPRPGNDPVIWSYIELDVTDLPDEYAQSLELCGNLTQTYVGSRNTILTFVMPPVIAEWTLNNYTSGNLPIQVKQNGSLDVFSIPPSETRILYSTFTSLSLKPPLSGDPYNS